eukprot:1196241-Amphidinium_carterae.1
MRAARKATVAGAELSNSAWEKLAPGKLLEMAEKASTRAGTRAVTVAKARAKARALTLLDQSTSHSGWQTDGGHTQSG